MSNKKSSDKISVTLNIDTDVLEWFKYQSDDYETLMNDVLRSHYEVHRDDTPKS